MIYNIIVDSNPAPTGGWAQSITVEIEMDSNPEYVADFGEGYVLTFHYADMDEDWSLAGLDDNVRERLADELAEKHLPPG